MASKLVGIMWYLDSGASFYMMGNRDIFSDFEEKYLKQKKEFEEDGRYSVTDISKITFERDITITDVMHVP